MTLLQTDFLPTKSETFQALRFMVQDTGLQTGIVNAGDYKATQHTPNNMTVDVALGSAWVIGQAGVTRQGIYHQVNDGTVNVGNFANSDPTNPRIDQVLLQINDSSAIGSSDTPAFIIAQGTPTAGATLDNRSGAVPDATLTSSNHNWMRIADVLIPANSTSVVTANIRDRRPWARGAFRTINRTGASDLVKTTSAFALVDSVNAQPRIECSGVPLRVTMRGMLAIAASGDWATFTLWQDGATPSGYSPNQRKIPPVLTNADGFEIVWNYAAPPAGSHLIGPAWATQLGTSNVTLVQTSGFSWDFTVEEIIRQNSDNT